MHFFLGKGEEEEKRAIIDEYGNSLKSFPGDESHNQLEKSGTQGSCLPALV